MATSNTQVTVYLPDNILEYVESYCKKFGIVRKKDDKAILATGIVNLLTMIVNTPIEDLADSKTLANQDIEGIIEKKLSDSTVLSKLLDTLLDNSDLRQRLKDSLVPDENIKQDNTLPSNVSGKLLIKPLFYRIKDNFLSTSSILTGEEVAKNLECTTEQFETKKGLSAIQAHFLPHLPQRPDGTYSNRVYEILIDSEKDVMPFVVGDTQKDDNGSIETKENEVKSLEEAINEVIIPKLKEGEKPSEIEKMLEGKYLASSTGKSTKWKGCLSRLVQKLKKEGKL
jgi:hypothetical protein